METVTCGTPSGTHEQCPPDYNTKDPGLEAATEGTLLGGVIRIVSGYNPTTRTFSRTRCSYQILKQIEIGWSHLSGGKGEKFFQQLAQKMPMLAAQVFGPQLAEEMKTDAWYTKARAAFRGEIKHQPEYDYLPLGWSQICKRADVQDLYTREWFSRAKFAERFMRQHGLKEKRSYAALVRMRNSGKQHFFADALDELGDETAAREAGLDAYVASGSHYSDDVERIRTWDVFEGDVQSWPSPSDLRWPDEGVAPSPPPPTGGTTQTPPSPPPPTGGTTQTPPSPAAALGLGVIVIGAFAAWRQHQDD